MGEERQQCYMNLRLTPNEVLYSFIPPKVESKDRVEDNPEYNEVYKMIRTSLQINEEGYNVYLIDNFSKEKIENLKVYIKNILAEKDKPKDICYVVYDDDKQPKALYLLNGNGIKLKRAVESIQGAYAESIFHFYNNATHKEKEEILQSIQRKRTELVTNLVEMAKKEGFDVKPSNTGFTFIPLKDGVPMTETDYDELEIGEKEEILGKVTNLKSDAQNILEELKDMEAESIDKIKNIMLKYFYGKRENYKKEFFSDLENDNDALNYMQFVCDCIESGVVENYSTNYEDDEEKINEIIFKYMVNVIVDNSGNNEPQVIFEEDPNVINLLGSTEYENHNGTYITDISLIQGGSLLKANEGCLIVRASNLLNNASAYYHLKKSLLSEKIKFDYNKGYLELLSLSGLKPEPIDINVKVILIGDYETYDILYSYDEDFKNIFKIRAEYSQIIDVSEENKTALIKNIVKTVNNNKLKSLTDEAIKEVAKYFSRKAGSRRKIQFDDIELKRLLIMANYKVEEEKRDNMESKDIIEVAYSKELIQKEILDNYRENKILIDVQNEIIGSINGLSVIDIGYYSFGKPLRITCNCYKGSGNIVDAHKESNLSGHIHNKSINILKGYLTKIFGGYTSIPVDFHLSFEQLYGKIEGDSASVAEIVCMISALSKIPVKQSIAVTGSINQFGEVQPIGGVNEKIEGFYNVCRLKGFQEGGGVLIPYSNKDELVLNTEVENAVKNNLFSIYVMTSVEEAVEVLMANDKYCSEDIFNLMQRELKRYNVKKS
jgi:lon-related putative ATP-dependent protease